MYPHFLICDKEETLSRMPLWYRFLTLNHGCDTHWTDTWRSNSDGTRGSSIFAAKDKHATDRSCNGHPLVCCKHIYKYQTVD